MKFFNYFFSGFIFFTTLAMPVYNPGSPAFALENSQQNENKKKLNFNSPKGAPAASREANTYNPQNGDFGGIRTFSSYSSPKTFNIYLNSENAWQEILNFMYDGLVATNPVTMEITPQLAENWEISEDKMTYKIKLRGGLKWSDGQPLNADDVIFTYNEILGNPDINNIYKEGLLIDEQLPVIEKIDNLHIKFITPSPFFPFLRKLDFPILPKHILEDGLKKSSAGEMLFKKWAPLDSDPASIVCNGPFLPEEFIPGKSIRLTANKYYWKKNSLGQQLPYLDQVNILLVNDPVDEYNKFILKEIDSLWITAKLGKFLKPKEKELNFSIYNLEQNSGSLFVMFNLSTANDLDGKPLVNPLKSSWFKNTRFRKALAFALDKKEIIKKVYNGFAMPQYTSFSQNNPYYNPAVPKYRLDLKMANQLLKEAGFKKNRKGVLTDALGNPVEFELVTNAGNSLKDKTSKIIIDDWKKLGIKVNFKTEKTEDLFKRIDRKVNWDAVLIGQTGNNIEPNEGVNTWNLYGALHMFNIGNSNRSPDWVGRETSYEKWEVDLQELFQKAAGEFNPEKRKNLYFKAQEIEAENLPFLYTAQPVPLVAVRNNIGNIFPSINAGNDLNAVNWNIEEQFIKQKNN